MNSIRETTALLNYEQDDKLGALSFVKKAISIDSGHEDANEFLLELKH